MRPLLNSKAVRELLGISAAALSRMVRGNRIPYVLLGSGKKKLTVRFRENELESWLDRRSRGAVPKPRSNLSRVDKNQGGNGERIENKQDAPFLETGAYESNRSEFNRRAEIERK